MSMFRPDGEDNATRIARALSRRTFLDRAFRGITAGAVGLVTTGTIFSGSARAGGDPECPCSAPRGVPCEGCPSGRKKKKCPEGYTRCNNIGGIPECPGCVYENAWWVSCTGLGEGLGYKICIDCWIEGDCDTTCGCQSKVICGHCKTAEDVKAEMALAQSGDD